MKHLIPALLAGAALAASSPAYAAVKTVVLVHGAFADGSGWKPVADILQSHGYSVRVVRSLRRVSRQTWLRRAAFSIRQVLVYWSATVMAG